MTEPPAPTEAAADALPTAVVLETSAGTRFLPVQAVASVVATPRLSAVPGALSPLVGVAVLDGEPVAVVALGEVGDVLVVCSHRGLRVALAGARVALATTPPAAATPLDLDELLADLRVAPPAW